MNLNKPSLYYQQLFLNQMKKKMEPNNRKTFIGFKKKKNNHFSSKSEIRRLSSSKEDSKCKNTSSINFPSKMKNV